MQIKIKIYVFLVINVTILLFGMQKTFSQNNNYYLAVESSISNFNLNSVTALETEQVQPNAFAITVKSNTFNYNVYASLYSFTSSNGYVLTSDVLAFKLRTVSPSRTANFNKIPLTYSNQLIIQGSKTSSEAITYTYDMHVGPVGFNVPPGSFNATILFTLSQQ